MAANTQSVWYHPVLIRDPNLFWIEEIGVETTGTCAHTHTHTHTHSLADLCVHGEAQVLGMQRWSVSSGAEAVSDTPSSPRIPCLLLLNVSDGGV